jgi:hypothetical protein
MKHLIALASALVLVFPSLVGSADKSLRDGTPCCWETLFRQGTLDAGPCGPTRGTILYAEGKFPKAKARFQNIAWKGKDFHGDGTFTNRWIGGIEAISAGVTVEPSWLDGQPCIVMQYAPDAKVFGNVRDELRLIAPGVWLGHSYDACTKCTKNWFELRCK